MVTISYENIITFASFLAAVIAIIIYVKKGVHWFDNQQLQDAEINSIKEEQTLLVYGVLACLKGLAEQGCDGPVHEAIDKIEKHINKKAHK